ncbi:Self-incompatibility protein [Trema orientale]|uniref:S-protein homolog n=1 Tax=Trema orientale TaxID=63057 RepID=A0A2P5ETD7_TREOI|nr:Self-incompatibility protein [Trema orientale]
MIKFVKLSLALLLWLLVATSLLASKGEGQEGDVMKRTVRVQNDLGSEILLHVHCKSADDDLGDHDLKNLENFEWSFRNNWLGTTLFWCRMKWDNVEGAFDVYTFERDFTLCGYKCWWSIRQDGAYFYHEFENVWEKRYVWEK